jgi:hypothetical protein
VYIHLIMVIQETRTGLLFLKRTCYFDRECRAIRIGRGVCIRILESAFLHVGIAMWVKKKNTWR